MQCIAHYFVTTKLQPISIYLLEHLEGHNAPYVAHSDSFEVGSDSNSLHCHIVSELQRDTLDHSHAIAFSWNGQFCEGFLQVHDELSASLSYRASLVAVIFQVREICLLYGGWCNGVSFYRSFQIPRNPCGTEHAHSKFK